MSKVTVPSTSVVDETAVIGEGTRVWNFVHIRENAKVGKQCVIADYVYVGRGVRIGDRVKLENRVTVFEGVTIQDNVFVGPHVTFTNDPYPRSVNPNWKISPTLVKEEASIGAGTVVRCGVTIGEYALIGAGSVVTTDIPSNALAYGNPARVRGFVCRCGKKLEAKEKRKTCVLMECQVCNKNYKIPTKDYAQLEKLE